MLTFGYDISIGCATGAVFKLNKLGGKHDVR
jgi:hypothetical protein